MSTSTDALICYGIAFEDGFQFPWDAEHYDSDIESWWLHALGFRRSFEIYDVYGEYLGGVEPGEARVDQYYQEQRDFENASPKLPVELVVHCSDNFPMYILAVPRLCLRASRGHPERFHPVALTASDEERMALVEFCEAHGIECADEPRWWLSSYWG